MKRRDVLGGIASSTALAGCSSVLEQEKKPGEMGTEPPREGDTVMGLSVEPIDTVQVGIIGLGGRGYPMTQLIHSMYPDKGVIKAICDIREHRVEKTYNYLSERGQRPDRYSGSKDEWKNLVKRDDLDLVFVFTHWEPHAPMAVYAMEQGKHVAMEVPAAITVNAAWDLVNTAERTQRHCTMLENVCYGEVELWILNMVKNGVFGRLTYGEAGYIHDLLDPMFSERHYNRYRLRNHLKRQGNLYPTHAIGPLAQYMDILRGDRFEYLISMSSPEESLTQKAQQVPSTHEFHGRDDFAHGDMNVTLIKTQKGRLITLKHDVVTHRPYDRINALAGTDGYHQGHEFPTNLSIKGEGDHGWLDDKRYRVYRSRYEHPIWDDMKEAAREQGGHGGKDFLELYRLFDALNEGRPLDMDVYDAATWSVIAPLSAVSIENNGKPITFPDFTRGGWERERELQILENP